MTDRRTTLLDGAIAVLGGQGVRAVTHRAVDAAAGLPIGSTSNHFRTRDDLLDATVIRIAERERASWDDLARREFPTSADELVDLFADFLHEATSTHRTLVLARYAILVEAGTRPALRGQLLSTGAGVNAWFLAWLRAAGFRDLQGSANLIMNYGTGLVLHELAIPDPAFDPRPHLDRLVKALLALSPEQLEGGDVDNAGGPDVDDDRRPAWPGGRPAR